MTLLINWTNHFTFLWLCFLIYKRGSAAIRISQSCAVKWVTECAALRKWLSHFSTLSAVIVNISVDLVQQGHNNHCKKNLKMRVSKKNKLLSRYMILCFLVTKFLSLELIFPLEKIYFCCCSVVKSCATLCNPMDCSTPGLPVLHYLPEFAQTHVHWVGEAILCCPLLLTSIFPSIRVFSN